jgi:DNA polymerase-3 subunit gamma/tau
MISLLQQVALYQTDPRLVIDGEFDEDLLQTYAQCWSVEEVQLYYQILLQGRQDLLISPDEAAGFEMLMLRLIAFSPEPELTGDSAEVKKKPELRPAEQLLSIGEQSSEGPVLRLSAAAASETSVSGTSAPAPAAIVSAAPPDEAATAEPSLAPQVEATAVPDIELAEISAPPVEATLECGKDVNATARAGFDWLTLAYDLGLNGIAQELVANSELVSHADNAVELALPRELHELVNDVTRSEISRALQQKLGVSWRLLMTASDSSGGTTPLLAKQERLRLERLAAIDAIREEALVKKLQHAFAAELDEASVVKIEGN